jgi:hypothetical protein
MDNHLYRTANTALATYLQTEGFSLLEVTTQVDPFHKYRKEAAFVFENSTKLHDTVYLWDTAKAVGNLNLYYHNYKATVAKAKMAVAVAEAPQGAEEHGGHKENKNVKALNRSPRPLAPH